MRQSLPALFALLSLFGRVPYAEGGQRDRPVPLSQRASTASSAIVGTVRDESGMGLADVSVLAVGTTLAIAKSDRGGRFAILVPAGEYILRAARDGYVSTYREAVRVQGDVSLHRTITLLKADGPAAYAQPAAAPVTPVPDETSADASRPRAGETAWRLRHLPRTVLRERQVLWEPGDTTFPDTRRGSAALDVSDHLASSIGAMPDFTGHVDLLTTSSLALASGAPLAADFPRGVAYVVVGAPVGVHGEWTIRTALSPGDSAAWTFSGEYRTRAENRHAFRTGVSYSAQTLQADIDSTLAAATPADVRRVGAAYAYDRWSVSPEFEVTYGGRLDRYDYLAQPTLAAGTIGGRMTVAPRAAVYADMSREYVAPGAQEFQPPSVTGVWLPPDRTFSALDGRHPLAAAALDRQNVGVSLGLGRRAHSSGRSSHVFDVHAGRFLELTDGQIATLFGVDATSEIGHYYVASVGSTRVEGMNIGFAGQLASNLMLRVDYAFTRTDWQRVPGSRLGRVARSRDNALGHDLMSSVDGVLPVTATRVKLVLRVNDAFSGRTVSEPGLGARFAVDLQQPLPMRLIGDEHVMLVVAARTLLKDLESGGGYLDDLVTVAPPLRVTFGIQMKF